jgi:hypothetical protein
MDMAETVPGQLLRIYVTEDVRHESLPLYEWIIFKARAHGLAGVTVLRAMEGFGAHKRLHTAKVLRLSLDLPVVIEIVDTREKIDAFIPVVDGVLTECVVTVEDVEIRIFTRG